MVKMFTRLINKNDYNKGYLNLLQKFANFSPNITETEFNQYLDNNSKYTKIIVIEDVKTQTIIGAGTLFIINKLHNNINMMGFIQDVVISEKYRGKGLGKKVVDKLYEVAKENRCYKVILNCNPDVENFYTKLGFTKKGFEFDKRI